MEAHPRVSAATFLAVDRDDRRAEPDPGWFASPLLREGLEALLGGMGNRDPAGLVEAALERERPLFLPRLDSWEAAGLLRERVERAFGAARGAEAWGLLAGASVIGCPVRTSMRRTAGVLVVASTSTADPLTRADLETVEVLADLAALVRERSDLLAAEAARAREELLLKRAAEGTAGSLEMPEVEQRVVEHTLRLLGADHARLSRVRPGQAALAPAARAGAPLSAEAAGVDAATLAEVARTRVPVTGSGQVSRAHVAVELGPRLFGVLSVVRLSGVAFSAHDLELLGTLAGMSAAAIANALEFDRERRVARALTRAFVPSAPLDMPDYEVGMLYEPAEHQPAGGDLFGTWKLPGGDVAVVVGDVAGKGIETAALSAMARFFIEARSWDCTSPAMVLAQASTMLHERLPHDTFVTAVFGIFSEHRIRYANAGHLPALVLRADGELSETGGRGLPLGIVEHPVYEDRELVLAPGDLVLAFTDGLVEARRNRELYGTRRMGESVRRAAALGADPQELLRTVYENVRDWAGGLSDDAAGLALRRVA
ncbi:hypothetical protein BH20ACT19_BH20ACT19_02450 [soil metagenome]